MAGEFGIESLQTALHFLQAGDDGLALFAENVAEGPSLVVSSANRNLGAPQRNLRVTRLMF